MTKIAVSTAGILSHKADCVVVGLPAGGKPAGEIARLDRASGGVLAALAARKGLVGSQPVMQALTKGPFKFACVVAAGEDKAGEAGVRAALARAFAQLARIDCASAVVHLPSVAGAHDSDGAAVRLAAQLAAAKAYKFAKGARLQTQGPARITLASADKDRQLSRQARIGAAIGEGMRIAKHLGEQPPNLLYPETLARQASKLGKAAGLKVKVLDRKRITALRMGGLLAVGKGSDRDPRLIVISHDGGAKSARPIALVGKGVTFDTGGYSLKPGAAMVDMKFDMCGAASVIGAMVAIARLGLKLNVVAVVPSAENMISGAAQRPDDIITMMDGTEVEVLNTDAEGRLILADALTYVQKFHKPKAIIDAATLTGACLIALGHHRSGMCANDDALAAELFAAGEASGDPNWRLPLDDAYDRLLDSPIADVPNIGGGRSAGTITAACFLQRFVKSTSWAHLDIAGSAWQNRRASGRPVPSLVTYLARKARLLRD